MKRLIALFLISFAVLLFVPIRRISAEDFQNAGFVSSPLWYSPDPFYEGDTVRIYTVVFNGHQQTLKGAVEFYDGETLLGQRAFSLPTGTSKEAYVSWGVTAGDHKIYAKIAGAKIVSAGGKEESVLIENAVTKADSRFVPKKVLSASSSASTNATDTSGRNSVYEPILKQVENLGDLVKKYVPESVQKPVIAIADTAEDVRTSIDTASDEGKKSAEAEIKKIEKGDAGTAIKKGSTASVKSSVSETKMPVSSSAKKPFEYVRLYFWSLVNFIASRALVFYGLIIALVLFIIRAFINRKK